MIQKIREKMATHQLDGMWITQPSKIELLTGIAIDPMERFLGVYLTQEKMWVVANVLFVLKPSTNYELVEHYDHHDVPAIIVQLSKGNRIGIDQWMPAKFCHLLYQEKEVVLASQYFDEILAIKTPAEIEKMIVASRVNDTVMSKVKGLLKVGISEIEVAKQIHELFLEHGASGESFETIVAFGDHGADPHAICSQRTLKPNESIIIDMGCIVDGYCSDMTRTFFLESNPIEQAYQTCLKANQAAIAAIQPGVTFAQVDQVARSIIEQAGYGKYFFHRLGHCIGKNVHEPFDVSGANHQLIQPGMCFSIEPGIYVEGQFGIRIEDLVYVDEQGFAQLLNHYDKNNVIIKNEGENKLK